MIQVILAIVFSLSLVKLSLPFFNAIENLKKLNN